MKLKAGGIFLAVVVVMSTAQTFAQNQLYIPPTISATEFDLTVAPSTYEFVPGTPVTTFGINGDILAPTLIFQKGDFVTLNVINNLNETTTMHWHGMHVPAADDGGPHSLIPANTTWIADFEVLDRATTFWYHPHWHENTARQVNMGLAGVIIVQDDEEAALGLPRTYGVDDIPLIIQDRAFRPNGQIDITPFGDQMMVNAILDPYVEVPAQVIRFRLLNGSSERVYNIGMSDNRNMYQIGSDGGLLESTVTQNRILLSPGERAEVLIDFGGNNGQTLSLMSYATEMPPGVPGGNMGPGSEPPLGGTDFDIMEIRVQAAAGGITTIPTNLVSHQPWQENEAVRTRSKTFNAPAGPGQPFTINNQVFNMMVNNDTVIVDDIEIWELTNESNIAHPFHIHDIQFYILDRNGQQPPENERGLKDVVLVYPNETVRFITQFADFADPEIPYMYHCHILPHEDGGMMGQFVVIQDVATSTDAEQEIPVTTKLMGAYPNPFNPATTINYNVAQAENLEIVVYTMLGQKVETLFSGSRSAGTYSISWNASRAASGVYFIRLISDSNISTIKVLLQK